MRNAAVQAATDKLWSLLCVMAVRGGGTAPPVTMMIHLLRRAAGRRAGRQAEIWTQTGNFEFSNAWKVWQYCQQTRIHRKTFFSEKTITIYEKVNRKERMFFGWKPESCPVSSIEVLSVLCRNPGCRLILEPELMHHSNFPSIITEFQHSLLQCANSKVSGTLYPLYPVCRPL